MKDTTLDIVSSKQHSFKDAEIGEDATVLKRFEIEKVTAINIRKWLASRETAVTNDFFRQQQQHNDSKKSTQLRETSELMVQTSAWH